MARGLLGFLFGKKDRFKKISNYTPEQENALRQYYQNPIQNQPLYQQGQGYLQDILGNDQASYDRFAAPHLRQFNENIVPGLLNRASGLGTGAGALNSSGLQNSLAQAAERLSESLASQKSGLQSQAANQALGYAQQPYSNALSGFGARQFENVYQPGSTGLLGGLLSGGGGALASSLGLGLGIPQGSGLYGSIFGGGGY